MPKHLFLYAFLSHLASAIACLMIGKKAQLFVFDETFGIIENLEKKNFREISSTCRKSLKFS